MTSQGFNPDDAYDAMWDDVRVRYDWPARTPRCAGHAGGSPARMPCSPALPTGGSNHPPDPNHDHDQETNMAKISSHNGRTTTQVRATRPGKPDTWLTLTVTSDGRLLRKITTAHRSQWGTHYSNSNNKVIATVTSPDDVTAERLMQIAARMGYPAPKDA